MRFVLTAVLLAVASPSCLAASGDLDPSFANGGTALATINVDHVTGLGLQPDGGIVVAGSRYAFDASSVSILIRYDAEGRLDTAFGNGGSVTEPGGLGAALLVESDGSIVVAGAHACDSPVTGCTATLRRYDAQGRLDPAFVAPDWTISPPTLPEVVVRQGDKIVVAGNAGHAPGFFVWLARHDADGSPDTTFGTNGLTLRHVSPHGASLGSVVVQADGSLLGGVTGGTAEGVISSVSRFTAAGGMDADAWTTFGYPKLALTPDRAVLAVGVLQSPDQPTPHLGLARFTAGLQPDPGFASGSTITGPTGAPGDMLVAPDGKIVVAAGLGESEIGGFAILRFTADGSPDATFGQQGFAIPFGAQPGAAQRATRQPDGKLVAAGILGNGGGGTVAVCRFLDDGPPTTTPSTSTTTTTTSPIPSPRVSPTTTTLRAPVACNNDAVCDDGDACTVDRCDAGRCVHAAAPGVDAVTCLCVSPMPTCDGHTRTTIGARLAKACGLLTRAAGARVGYARRLLRRALRLVRADEHAMATGRATCGEDVGARLGELERRSRDLLRELR